jgi:hypothetical protein
MVIKIKMTIQPFASCGNVAEFCLLKFLALLANMLAECMEWEEVWLYF